MNDFRKMQFGPTMMYPKWIAVLAFVIDKAVHVTNVIASAWFSRRRAW